MPAVVEKKQVAFLGFRQMSGQGLINLRPGCLLVLQIEHLRGGYTLFGKKTDQRRIPPVFLRK
jgi:hypothetical protein